MIKNNNRVKKLDLFGDDDTGNGSKSVDLASFNFDLVNNKDIEEPNKDVNKNSSRPQRKSKVGSYNKSLFEDTSDKAQDNITNINMDLDYDDIIKSIEQSSNSGANKPTTNSDKDNDSKIRVKKLDAFNDFDGIVVNAQEPIVNSPTLDGIRVSNTRARKISTNPKVRICCSQNVIDIDSLESINAIDDNISCRLSDGEANLELIGFTNRFEALFKIRSNVDLISTDSNILFTENNIKYLLVNVDSFDLDEPIVIDINGNSFEINFHELNKRITSIKSVQAFAIDIIDINRI